MCLVCSFSEMAAKNVLYFSKQTKQIFNLLSGTFFRLPQRRIRPISSSLRNLIKLDKEVTFSCCLVCFCCCYCKCSAYRLWPWPGFFRGFFTSSSAAWFIHISVKNIFMNFHHSQNEKVKLTKVKKKSGLCARPSAIGAALGEWRERPHALTPLPPATYHTSHCCHATACLTVESALDSFAFSDSVSWSAWVRVCECVRVCDSNSREALTVVNVISDMCVWLRAADGQGQEQDAVRVKSTGE